MGQIRGHMRGQQTLFSVFFVRNRLVLTHIYCTLEGARRPWRVRPLTLRLPVRVLFLRRVSFGAC